MSKQSFPFVSVIFVSSLFFLLVCISPVQSVTHHNQYSFTHILDSSIEKEYLIFLHEPPAIRAKQFGTQAMMSNIERVDAEQEQVRILLAQQQIGVMKSTSLASNTLLVYASLVQVEQLKQEGVIRDYVENVELELLLDESVPFLDIPLIWEGVDYGYTGQGVRIGVIDTGIDYTHPALGGCFGPGCKVFAGYDFGAQHDHPEDTNGHGTMVAAIIAGDDAEGLRGVAPDARLVSMKVLGGSGGGTGSIAQAYDYAVDLNRNGIPFENEDDYVHLVSISLAAGGNNAQNALSLLADELMREGVLVVVAAGNSGPADYSVRTPGSSRESLTVGASVNNHGRQGSISLDGVPVAGTIARHSGIGVVTGRLVDAGIGEDFSTVQPGEIVVVRSGSVEVNQQVIGAQERGAVGLIIINNAPQEFQPRVYMNTPLIVVGVASDLEQTLSSSVSASLTSQYQTDLAHSLASYSSRGPVSDANNTFIVKPDVLAPGSSICSAHLEITDQHCFAGVYHMTSGTSLAAPHVSGLAALLVQAHPDWDPFMLRDAIKSSAKSINTARNAQGFGLVNPVQLFDATRSILRDTRLFFGRSEVYNSQRFVILNPNNFDVTYYLTISSEIFSYPEIIIVPALSEEEVVVELNQFPTSSFVSEVQLVDSLGHKYVVPFIVDDKIRITVQVIRPALPQGYEDDHFSIDYLHILDAETLEHVDKEILVFDEEDTSTVELLYDADESFFAIAVASRNPFDRVVDEQGQFFLGEQFIHVGFSVLESSNVVINLSECQSFVIEAFPDGYFSSLLSLTYREPLSSEKYETLVFPGHTSYVERAFTNLSRGLDEYDFHYINNSHLTLCLPELPDSFFVDMLAVQHEDNDVYITKNRLDPFTDYDNSEEYLVDELFFGTSDIDEVVHPYYQFKDRTGSVVSFHTHTELVPSVNTSLPITIHSSMDSDSFDGKTLDIFYWGDRPVYELVEEGGIGETNYFVLVHWNRPFFVLPSYTFIDGQRKLFTSDCFISDDVPFSILSSNTDQYSSYAPEQLLFENIHFISNVYNISPGQLQFHNKFLSSSHHPSMQFGFFNQLVGLNTYVVEQNSQQSDTHYWCYDAYVDVSSDTTVFPADLTKPFTLRSEFPSDEQFASEAYVLDSHSMNVSFSFHTTMNPLDANPPRLMGVNVTDQHAYLAVYDEELVTVEISIDGVLVDYDLIGDPFSQQPPDNYLVRPEHFFRVSIPEDDQWHRLSVYSQDAVGNWMEQSFSVRRMSVVEDPIGFSFEDFLLFSTAYGSTLGDDSYVSLFDFDQDGSVGLVDLVLFGSVVSS